jgi:sulfite dehydrogenase (cytochrome) subunit A
MKRIYFYTVLFAVGIECKQPEKKVLVQSETTDSKDIMVKAEGKDSMILLTDRPPNLETPLKYFLQDYTPNNVFFVRWHLSKMPSKIDIDTFKLRVTGNVQHELALSMNDLKTKFQPYTIVALAECAGNSRSFFDPRVPGGQWKNGAMGNAKWTGVKVKDILSMAGLKPDTKEVAFNGIDAPPLESVPDFIKSLEIAHAIDGEVMIAYEMNGEPLPLLNGYPLKLVVPGWYATYWVGMLNDIRLYSDTFRGYWMKKAYLVPKDVSNGNEKPDTLAKDLVPITRLDVRSIFVSPEPETIVKKRTDVEIQGLAFDGGYGISKVEISVDNTNWVEAKLDPEIGKYSWRRWRYTWKPSTAGTYHFKVKATNAKGETQPEHQWNRSGYMRNEIETLTLKAE